MKPVYVIAIIVLIIVILGNISSSFLNNESEELIKLLDQLEEQVSYSDWKKALDINNKFEERWKVSQNRYLILIEHYEIDSINLKFSELKSYIASQDKTQSLARLSALKLLLKHIPKKETIELTNIL